MRLTFGISRPYNNIIHSPIPNNICVTIYPPRLTTSFSHHYYRLKRVVRSSWNSDNQGSAATHSAVLGNKWMEYQGIKNWDGLLDPLDDHLRGEILRYGAFVQAAYRSFEFDTSSPDYAACRHAKEAFLTRCGLAGIGYEMTRDLHATCGIRLPSWIDRMPNWATTRSSWIGYVAVCSDPGEIARLGRRDVVIAYRGTATCLEWLENLRATLTSVTDMMDPESGGPMVESGFLSMYTSGTPTCPSLRDTVKDEIAKIILTYGDEPLSVTITGHSLGAALATLTAYDVTAAFDNSPLVTVVSFGGPRVGNKCFRRHLEKSGTKVLRIVNSDDVITKVPGFVVDNDDVGSARLPRLPRWMWKRVENSHRRYADVGKELRLSSRESTSFRKGDFATCHDLKTYLHLVDAFS